MDLSYDGQLVTTTFSVTFRGNTLKVENAIVDTGASHTVISPDILESIGVSYESGDIIYEAYGIGGSVPFYTKVMDEIRMDSLVIKDVEIDVGILPRDHSALLGLDILKEHRFTIDLDRLKLIIPDCEREF